MLKPRYFLAAAVALALSGGLAYYGLRSGESGSGNYPQVSGRLLDMYEGEGYDGFGFRGYCEYDAFVGVAEGNVVVEVLEEGSRGVDVGSKVIGTIFVGAVKGRGDGPSGVQNLGVYLGEDGNLYAGCAPESMAERDDGTRIRITDLPKSSYASP